MSEGWDPIMPLLKDLQDEGTSSEPKEEDSLTLATLAYRVQGCKPGDS